MNVTYPHHEELAVRQPGILDPARCGTAFSTTIFPGSRSGRPKDVRVRPSVGNCLLILRRYCGKEDHQLAEVVMFVRGKLLQGEVQHAQANETGTGRATVVTGCQSNSSSVVSSVTRSSEVTDAL